MTLLKSKHNMMEGEEKFHTDFSEAGSADVEPYVVGKGNLQSIPKGEFSKGGPVAKGLKDIKSILKLKNVKSGIFNFVLQAKKADDRSWDQIRYRNTR